MNFLSLMRVETGRYLRSRLTWLGILLTVVSPVAGVWLYRPLADLSINGAAIGNPALAGAIFGAVVFAVMTASAFNNKQRFRTEVITDSICSPFQTNIAQTLAVLFSVVIAQSIALIAWLPYSIVQLGDVFSLKLYLSVYLCTMLPAIGFAALFTAAAFQITRRFDLSLVLFAAFSMLSITVWHENWLLRWMNPAISYISDVFGNERKIMSVSYNRLIWVFVILGLWAASFLCVRRYGKGIMGSALRNSRKLYIPLIAAALMFSGGFAYANQPFLDNSKELIDYSGVYFSGLDSEPSIICSGIYINAMPNLSAGSYYAIATYKLHNNTGEGQTISLKINPGYKIFSAVANTQPISVRDLADDDMNVKTVEVDLPPDPEIELILEYGGFPTEWNITSLRQGEPEISRDYIYLANMDFSPRSHDFISDEESFTFIADIDLPEGMVPVLFGNGTAEMLETGSDTTNKWRLTCDSQIIILYAGDYVSHHIEAAGIDVEFIYSRKHQGNMAEYDMDSIIRNVFEYCTEHFGRLSFMTDDKMKLIEIGSFGGGYAGNGASVMGEGSFSTRKLSDHLSGAGGDEVLAHEIIHQWWGLGNMFDAAGEDSLWSAEGLTVYTTYRLMKELYGEKYAINNYVDVWRRETDNYNNNFYIRNHEYFDALPEAYGADILNSCANMRRYCEMPLMLLKAEELLGGEEAFDKVLYEIFNREYNEDYSNLYLSYELFLEYCGLKMEDLHYE